MNKISIITVTFNAESCIENTILSVISQTYSNYEYIIIDGGSSDKTRQIIEKYQKHLSYWVSEKDTGIYDAMNKGIIHSTGEWLIFMNAGDLFHNNTVLFDIFQDQEYTNYDILYGDVNATFLKYNIIQKSDAEIQTLTKRMFFSHQSSFIRKDLMLQYKYDLKYKIIADYAFFLKAYFNKYKFKYIPIIVSTCNKYEGVSASTNYNQYKKLVKEHITLSSEFNLNMSLNLNMLCFRYLLKSCIRMFIPKRVWAYILAQKYKD